MFIARNLALVWRKRGNVAKAENEDRKSDPQTATAQVISVNRSPAYRIQCNQQLFKPSTQIVVFKFQIKKFPKWKLLTLSFWLWLCKNSSWFHIPVFYINLIKINNKNKKSKKKKISFILVVSCLRINKYK